MTVAVEVAGGRVGARVGVGEGMGIGGGPLASVRPPEYKRFGVPSPGQDHIDISVIVQVSDVHARCGHGAPDGAPVQVPILVGVAVEDVHVAPGVGEQDGRIGFCLTPGPLGQVKGHRVRGDIDAMALTNLTEPREVIFPPAQVDESEAPGEETGSVFTAGVHVDLDANAGVGDPVHSEHGDVR